MRWFRLSITVLVQLVLLLLMSGPGAIGASQFGETSSPGVGSCATGSMGGCSGSALSDSDGSAGFDLGYPVDIPSPVAKGIEGVNASTVTFATASNNISVPLLTKQDMAFLTGSDLGTITATVPSGSTLGVIVGGDYVDSVKVSGTTLTYSVPVSYLNQPIAFVVMGSGSTIYNHGYVSYPVIVTVVEVAGEFTITVAITNESLQSGAAIRNSKITISSDNIVAFSALDSSSNPYVGKVDTKGGSFTTFSSSNNSVIRELTYSPDDILYGINSSNAIVRFNNTTGVATTIVDGDSTLTERTLAFSPNGDWMVTQTKDSGSLKPLLVEVDHPTNQITVSVTDGELNVTELSTIFIGNDMIGLTKKYSDDSYVIAAQDIVDILDGSTTTAELQIGVTATTRIGKLMTPNNQNGNFVWYECDTAEGITNLCVLDLQTMSEDTAIEAEDYSVKHAVFSDATSCIAFETDTDSSVTTDNRIGIFNPATGETALVTKGFNPDVYTNGITLNVSYLFYDSTGTTQVGVFKVTQDCDTSGLDVTGPVVDSISPYDGETDVAVDTDVIIDFQYNDVLSASILDDSTLTFLNANTGDAVGFRWDFLSGEVQSLVLYPTYSLTLATEYEITLTADIKDRVGNPMGNDFVSTFVTVDGAWEASDKRVSSAAVDSSSSDIAYSTTNAVAVWLENDGVRNNVWGNVYSVSTGLWGTPQLLESTVGTASSPKVAVDSHGNAVVVWVQDNDTATETNLLVTKYFASSGWQGSLSTLDTQVSAVATPLIAFDSNSKAHVIWVHSGDTVWASQYNSSYAWTTAAQISGALGTVAGLDLDVNSSGDAVATWGHFSAGTYIPQAVRFASSSSTWGTPVTLSAVGVNSSWISAELMDDGKAIVIWLGEDGAADNVHYSYSLSGTTWSTDSTLDNTAFNATMAFGSSDSTSHAQVAWAFTDAGVNTIRFSTFDFSTLSWDTLSSDVDQKGVGIFDIRSYGDKAGNAFIAYIFNNSLSVFRYQKYTDSVVSSAVVNTSAGTPTTPAISINSNGQAVVIWNNTTGTVNSNFFD